MVGEKKNEKKDLKSPNSDTKFETQTGVDSDQNYDLRHNIATMPHWE